MAHILGWGAFLSACTCQVHYLQYFEMGEVDVSDPKAAAAKLCECMSTSMGVEVVPATYQDKMEYFKFLLGRMGQLKKTQ